MEQFSRGQQPSASARRTAGFIGCNYKKVDKIRKIRNDGAPEIQEAVKNDKLSINGAYNKICKMKQGEETGNESSAPPRTRTGKLPVSDKIIVRLKEFGGDLGSHAEKGMEMYIRWVEDKDQAKT